jgi:hypothetical protein
MTGIVVFLVVTAVGVAVAVVGGRLLGRLEVAREELLLAGAALDEAASRLDDERFRRRAARARGMADEIAGIGGTA